MIKMNYAKLFEKYSGKQIQVVTNDGYIFEGEFFAYISAADNEPDPESIVVDRTELYTNEIRSLSVM